MPNAPRRNPRTIQIRSGTGAQKWPDLEAVVRWAGFVALLSYVSGLIAVNAYLFNIGTSDFALVRPRYVFTGLIVIMLQSLALVLGSVPVIIIHVILKPRAFLRSLPDWLAGVLRWFQKQLRLFVVYPVTLALVLFTTIASISILFGLPGVGLRNVWTPRRALGTLLFIGLADAFWLYVVWVVNEGYWSRKLIRINRLTGFSLRISHLVLAKRLVASIVLVVNSFVGCVVVGTGVYGSIAQQFGGGQPRWVQLMLTQDGAHMAQTLGLSVYSDGSLTTHYPLLWENEESYIIQLDSGGRRFIVKLERELVSGIAYLDQRRFPWETSPSGTPLPTPLPTSESSPSPGPAG